MNASIPIGYMMTSLDGFMDMDRAWDGLAQIVFHMASSKSPQ